MAESPPAAEASVATFEFLHPETNELVHLEIRQLLTSTFGLFLWPASVVLAEYLVQNLTVRHARILELGAGCSLPGLVAAALGASHVYLTDRSSYPEIFVNAQESITRNQRLLKKSRIEMIPFDWGVFPKNIQHICESVDLIFSSDCFYHAPDFEKLIMTIEFILSKNPTACFYGTYHLRSITDTIGVFLEKWGLAATFIPLPVSRTLELVASRDSIYLVQIQKIQETSGSPFH